MGRIMRLRNDQGQVYKFDLSVTVDQVLEDAEPEYGRTTPEEMSKHLEGVPGKAILRGPEISETEERYEDTWNYISERLEMEDKEVRTINPESDGRMPRTWVTAQIDDGTISQHDLDYITMVQIHYDESWDDSVLFADHYAPEELRREN